MLPQRRENQRIHAKPFPEQAEAHQGGVACRRTVSVMGVPRLLRCPGMGRSRLLERAHALDGDAQGKSTFENDLGILAQHLLEIIDDAGRRRRAKIGAYSGPHLAQDPLPRGGQGLHGNSSLSRWVAKTLIWR